MASSSAAGSFKFVFRPGILTDQVNVALTIYDAFGNVCHTRLLASSIKFIQTVPYLSLILKDV